MKTIAITCGCSLCAVLGDEIISSAVGMQVSEPIRLYPGGALHLHPTKKGTDEYQMTKVAVGRKSLDTEDGQLVQFILAVHANSEYMNSPDNYLWVMSRGLTALLSDCKKTVIQYSPREVLEVRKIQYTIDLKNGSVWWDITDSEHIVKKE